MWPSVLCHQSQSDMGGGTGRPRPTTNLLPPSATLKKDLPREEYVKAGHPELAWDMKARFS